jgi:hypothetical protein
LRAPWDSIDVGIPWSWRSPRTNIAKPTMLALSARSVILTPQLAKQQAQVIRIPIPLVSSSPAPTWHPVQQLLSLHERPPTAAASSARAPHACLRSPRPYISPPRTGHLSSSDVQLSLDICYRQEDLKG